MSDPISEMINLQYSCRDTYCLLASRQLTDLQMNSSSDKTSEKNIHVVFLICDFCSLCKRVRKKLAHSLENDIVFLRLGL